MAEYRYGFIDKSGRFVIEPKYEEAGDFHEGLAWVKLGDKRYEYIDKAGRYVLDPDERCISVGSFHEGVAIIQVGNYRFGIIDKTGRRIGSWVEWAYLFHDFHEGLACVKIRDGEYGFIDKTGRFVIAPQFKEALNFQEGLSLITLDRQKCGFIDKSGRYVVEPRFKYGPLRFGFSEGLAAVNFGVGDRPRPDDKYGYIDKTGRIVIEPKFKSAFNFHEGLARVNSGDKRGFINKTGQFAIDIDKRFGSFYDFFEGRALVECDGKWGYLDKTGNIAINPKFEEVSVFHEGLASVCVDSKYGFIDKSGQFVITPKFEKEPSDFCEGFARVRIERKIQHPVTESSKQVSSQTTQKISSPATKPKTNSGCYIATAVYGSYDCPEVWTLRRYRDNVLDSTWYGRAFIRTYYAISPTLVKWFGKTYLFRNLLGEPLNKWVEKLNKRGFENTPYNDKY